MIRLIQNKCAKTHLITSIKSEKYPWKMIQKVNGWEYGTNYKFLKNISILDFKI